MQHLVRGFLFFLMVFLAGCASNIKLDPATKPRLDDGIAINPVVTLADQPYFHGRTQTWGGALGGAVGAGIAAAATSEPAKIKQYLAAEGIDVSSIVLEEFERQIKNRPGYADRIRDDGKFRLQLVIHQYGIVSTNVFTSTYKPVLGLIAQLRDPTGNIIWQQSDFIANLNSRTQGYPYDHYFNTPETFKAAFQSAAEAVVSLVLEKLE